MKLQLVTALAGLLAICVVSGAFAIQSDKSAPPFKLDDQFGKTWDLSKLKSTVVVVVVANADSGRKMGPWVDRLKKDYPKNARILGLMDLHHLPGIVRGIAKGRIRKETKDPLMLDFNGSTAKSYSVSDKHPVVVVIDRKGVVRSVEATDYTPAAYEATSAAIDKALESKNGNK